MKLIVTSGGTRERIDAVRSITNEATGKLGSLIAEEFSQRLTGREHDIYYICGKNAVLPETMDDRLHILHIEGTDQLMYQMHQLLTTQKIDAVIHSAAVSDYKVNNVTTVKRLAQLLYKAAEEEDDFGEASYEEWQKVILKALKVKKQNEDQKISSDLDSPLLLLEKTPKIISMIKDISPQTILVGFKLLSGVEREKLFDVAYKLLQKNKCDFVLANDTNTIKGDTHVGYLMDAMKNYRTFTTKKEIAKGIADELLQFT